MIFPALERLADSVREHAPEVIGELIDAADALRDIAANTGRIATVLENASKGGGSHANGGGKSLPTVKAGQSR